MWPPFVKQCIAMVRDHEHNYVRGPGYNKDDDGNVTERCASATFAGLLYHMRCCVGLSGEGSHGICRRYQQCDGAVVPSQVLRG